MEVELARDRVHAKQLAWRSAVVALIGPLTALGGVVWAIAQPYRLTLLDGRADALWDHLAQPPLLVVGVALFFEFVIARPLLRELRGDS